MLKLIVLAVLATALLAIKYLPLYATMGGFIALAFGVKLFGGKLLEQLLSQSCRGVRLGLRRLGEVGGARFYIAATGSSAGNTRGRQPSTSMAIGKLDVVRTRRRRPTVAGHPRR